MSWFFSHYSYFKRNRVGLIIGGLFSWLFFQRSPSHLWALVVMLALVLHITITYQAVKR